MARTCIKNTGYASQIFKDLHGFVWRFGGKKQHVDDLYFAYSKKRKDFQTHPHHGQIPQKTVGRAEYESRVTSFRTRMVWWILKKEPKSACLKKGQLWTPLGAKLCCLSSKSKACQSGKLHLRAITKSSCLLRHTHPKIHLFRSQIMSNHQILTTFFEGRVPCQLFEAELCMHAG